MNIEGGGRGKMFILLRGLVKKKNHDKVGQKMHLKYQQRQ